MRARFDVFDGLRGHLLLGMLIYHFSVEPGLAWLDTIHHKTFIGLKDAEFFVLIAGLLVGYLWNNVYISVARQRAFVAKRLWTIYKYYLLSALPVLAYAVVNGFGFTKAVFGVATMQTGGWYSDILPIYFVCFLLLGLFTCLPNRNLPLNMVIISAGIYGGAQFSDLDGFFGWSSRFAFFDFAAWQFLFVVSVILGRNGTEVVDRIRNLSANETAVLMIGLSGVYAMLSMTNLYFDPMRLGASLSFDDARMGLHPIYLLRILIMSALIAFVLLRTDAWLKPLHSALHWYFSLSVLRNIGRFSIQIFVFHIYILAVYRVWFVDAPAATQAAFALGAVAIYILAPNIVVWQKSGWPWGIRRQTDQPSQK